MTNLVDLRQADDRRDVIHRAVHLLAEGKLVAFPTETVYVAAAHSLRPDSVARLKTLVRHAGGSRCQLGIKSAEEALDYVPAMPPLGQRLSRRCWPGPVTFEFDAGDGHGLLRSLPGETRAAVAPEGRLRLRAPAHDLVYNVLRLMPAPLVLSDESIGSEPASTAADMQQLFGDEMAVILDDGPCRYGEPATVVQIADADWKIVAPGVVRETTLGRLASEMYLFVCTGNTCRSPMAEGLFRKLLSEKLECSEDELCDRGFTVASAGLAAAAGSPAALEAIELFSQRGIDLNAHESQPVTNRLLDQADHIYTMTRNHRDSIVAARPDVADRVEVLSRDGADISDPIGGDMSDYEICGAEIERHIRAIIEKFRA